MENLKIYQLRVFLFLTFSILVYLTNSIDLLMFELVFALLIFLTIKESFRFLKGLLVANTFTFFIVITLLLTDFSQNFNLALIIFLKSNTILLLTFSLVLPIGVLKLIKTFESLKFPKKLTLLMLLSYRYISTFREEFEKLRKAAVLRGLEPKMDIQTYRTYGYLLGVLVLKTFVRAKEVYKSMVLRGLES